jgi:hypothetical protein
MNAYEKEYDEYDDAQECCADEEEEDEDEIDMLTRYKW